MEWVLLALVLVGGEAETRDYHFTSATACEAVRASLIRSAVGEGEILAVSECLVRLSL